MRLKSIDLFVVISRSDAHRLEKYSSDEAEQTAESLLERGQHVIGRYLEVGHVVVGLALVLPEEPVVHHGTDYHQGVGHEAEEH